MVREPGERPESGGESGDGHGTRATMAETATAAAEQMQTAATDQIEQQQRAASQSLQAFAQAVRRASDELSKQDQSAAAQLIHQAAGGLEDLSQTLANQSLGELVATARDFGRRNPFALAGGAALLGMALGRVARTKSASQTAEQSATNKGLGSSARKS
jgi:galactokinase/mevalonate kinase-like predicted kinase